MRTLRETHVDRQELDEDATDEEETEMR